MQPGHTTTLRLTIRSRTPSVSHHYKANKATEMTVIHFISCYSGQAPMHQILNARFGAKEVYNSNSVAAIAGTNQEMANSSIIPGAKE